MDLTDTLSAIHGGYSCLGPVVFFQSTPLQFKRSTHSHTNMHKIHQLTSLLKTNVVYTSTHCQKFLEHWQSYYWR